eukprot:14309603-Ditylum_brightwellii.AAC.1
MDALSSNFLYSSPDAAGFISYDEFIEIFNSYLGFPSACCAPFVGQHIGSEGKQQRVNEHRNIAVAPNAVPVARDTIVGVCIKLVFGDMAKVSGMQLQYEAENTFHCQ